MSEPETGEARMQRLSIMVPIGYVTPERRPGGWARYVPIVTARDAIRQAEAELRTSLAANVRALRIGHKSSEQGPRQAGFNRGLEAAAALIEGSDPASPEEALDVERLARALSNVDAIDNGYSEHQRARLIAHEYGRG